MKSHKKRRTPKDAPFVRRSTLYASDPISSWRHAITHSPAVRLATVPFSSIRMSTAEVVLLMIPMGPMVAPVAVTSNASPWFCHHPMHP